MTLQNRTFKQAQKAWAISLINGNNSNLCVSTLDDQNTEYPSLINCSKDYENQDLLELFKTFNPKEIESKKANKPRYPLKGSISHYHLNLCPIESVQTCSDFFIPLEDMEKKQTQYLIHPFYWTEEFYENNITDDLESNNFNQIILLIHEDSASNILIHTEIPENQAYHLTVLLSGKGNTAVYLDVKAKENSQLSLAMTNYEAILENKATASKFTINTLHQGKKPKEKQHFLYAIQAGKNTKIETHVLAFHPKVQSEGLIFLNEPKASALSKTAAYITSKTTQRFATTIYHKTPKTTSSIENHGVMNYGGRGNFTARGYIDKGAKNAKCFQESRFLSLDEKSHANSYPILMIDEYDVEAGHSASNGQVDQNALFYLQSRGLDEKSALQLMTASFLKPILNEVNDLGLRYYLLQILNDKVVQL